VALNRFNIAYHGLFKTNIKRLENYLAITQYLEYLLQFENLVKNVASFVSD